MAVSRAKAKKKVEVKRRKPKATTATMIKRYQAKLKRLKDREKLNKIKEEVQQMADSLKT